MGGYFSKNFPNLTISTSGGVTNSGSITLLDDLVGMDLMTSGLTGTVTVQVSYQESTAPTDWFNLQSAGASVVLAASGAVTINPSVYRSLRVQAASTEASPRTVYVMGQVYV